MALPIVGILSGLGQILGFGKSVASRVAVDKDLVESNVHSEQETATNAMAAENVIRPNRTWWDSLVDGICRLPRPIFAFMVVFVLLWAPIDPIGFSAAMTAYALVPMWMAAVMGQIVLLYMGGRMLQNGLGQLNGPTQKQVANVLENMKNIMALKQKGVGTVEEVDAPSQNSVVDNWAASVKPEDEEKKKESEDEPMEDVTNVN